VLGNWLLIVVQRMRSTFDNQGPGVAGIRHGAFSRLRRILEIATYPKSGWQSRRRQQ
jgi:hypothetical protein